MYIDFNYYQDNGGSITDEPTFNRYNRQAQSLLNYLTFNRVEQFEESAIPEEVKLSIVDIIDLVDAQNKRASELGGDGVKSMSNNGISISLETSVKEEYNKKISDVININLDNVYTPLGIKLIYRGN